MCTIFRMVNHDARMDLRVPPEELEQWRRAAEGARMTLSAWIRYQCNRSVMEQVAPKLTKHQLLQLIYERPAQSIRNVRSVKKSRR